MYNHDINRYEKELTYYRQFMRGIGAVMTLINQTTGPSAKPFIRDMDMSADVRQALIQMRRRFALDDDQRIRILRKQYQMLLVSIPKLPELDKRITEWESIYADCMKYGLPEGNNDRAAEDFVQSMRVFSDEFYMSSAIRNRKTWNITIDFYEVIRAFRAHVEVKGIDKKKPT